MRMMIEETLKAVANQMIQPLFFSLTDVAHKWIEESQNGCARALSLLEPGRVIARFQALVRTYFFNEYFKIHQSALTPSFQLIFLPSS